MKRIVIWLAGLLLFSANSAHPAGTIEKINSTGTIYLGYQVSSAPFSFLDNSHPIGYSIDLCNSIVDEISTELGKPVRVEYRLAAPADRFSGLVSGDFDLLCGIATITPERQERVGFSPTIFVAGAKLLVEQSSKVGNLRDLQGKRIAVTQGTTTLTLMRDLVERQRLNITLVVGNDPNKAVQYLLSGKVDAFVNDDVLLYGFLANTSMGDKYRIVGDCLSYESYGLAFRKDDYRLSDLIERVFEKIANSGEILRLYEKWFLGPLPSGISLNMPMGAELTERFRQLALTND